jgi:hypothetical protein
LVWEYINPYSNTIGGKFSMNMVYRAYRVPYDWVPQLEKPKEASIEAINVSTLRVPGASIGEGTGKVTTIAGVDPNKRQLTGGGLGEDDDSGSINFCVVSIDKDSEQKN